MPSKSSITPILVVPEVATTAHTRCWSCSLSAAKVRRTAAAVSRPVSSTAAVTKSASIAFAAKPIDECAPPEAMMIGRSRSAWPRRCARHDHRAAMSADKLPLVPPLTNTPPAVSGRPARPTNHCNAWFSAYTAPAPSSHEPAYTFDAPTTRSNNTDDSVGAPGTNDRNNGWSTLMQEGASCSVKISSAFNAPKPSGVMV